MTIPSIPKRPEPIREAFKSVGSAIALAGSVTGSVVGWGILTEAQGDAVTGLLGAIPGAITLVTALLTAFGVINHAEPRTTPVADPRSDDGVTLVRRLPAGAPGTIETPAVGEHRLR